MSNENREILELKSELEQLKKKYEEQSDSLKASKVMLSRINSSYIELEQEHNKVLNSRGWKLIVAIQGVRNRIMPLGSRRWNVFKAIAKPILKPFFWCFKRLGAKKQRGSFLSSEEAFKKLKRCERIDIVAIKHTKYVAELLKGVLKSFHIECEIHLEEPAIYEDIPYIMICPQSFKRFPKLYIAFQMEQTVNPRWLTDNYIKILRGAYAVFDYSMVNIEYFSADPVLAPKLYYMPIDICEKLINENKGDNEKEYDVLFYGDPYIERRKQYLDKIAEKYQLKILSDTFGEELYNEMRKAKIIINAHYYENALLETTRLYEALSKSDCLIISERSRDEKEEMPLESIIDFTKIGDIDEMLDRIGYWLDHEEERKNKVRENIKLLITRANAAKFFLGRFLLANDRISFDDFYKASGDFIEFKNDRICLSLPECTDRKKAFDNDNNYGFTFFPGLKHKLGWVGCGMSYKFILKKAAEQKLERILVCEDDVYFPPDFQDKFEKVLKFLEEHTDWNVFSGIMADVGRVKILEFCEENGIDFVYLDKMISMVFNLYDKSVFSLISDWDETDRDVETNAIDRYLEDKKLRIVTTCPFLVGHKEDLNSTIWGQQNTIYSTLIADSSKKLREMTEAYKKN